MKAMIRAGVLALLVVLLSLGQVSDARAGDPPPPFSANCIEHVDCYTEVTMPGQGSSGKPTDPPGGGGTKKKSTPLCSSFSGGVVVPVGTPLTDIPKAHRPGRGWIRVNCLVRGAPMWLWMEPGVNAETLARTLIDRMHLQPIDIGWTPLRNGSMGIVGIPTWLWAKDPGRQTWGPAGIRAGELTLTAQVLSVTWSMGNGDEVQCSSQGTPWRWGMGAGPSPTCGYTYIKQGSYKVTATAHWEARWSGYGRSGAIPFDLSQTRTLEIGEIQVVRIR